MLVLMRGQPNGHEQPQDEGADEPDGHTGTCHTVGAVDTRQPRRPLRGGFRLLLFRPAGCEVAPAFPCLCLGLLVALDRARTWFGCSPFAFIFDRFVVIAVAVALVEANGGAAASVSTGAAVKAGWRGSCGCGCGVAVVSSAGFRLDSAGPLGCSASGTERMRISVESMRLFNTSLDTSVSVPRTKARCNPNSLSQMNWEVYSGQRRFRRFAWLSPLRPACGCELLAGDIHSKFGALQAQVSVGAPSRARPVRLA
eukprot:scaffold97129_cov63-Phaeocystis_antarctica.AAC.2